MHSFLHSIICLSFTDVYLMRKQYTVQLWKAPKKCKYKYIYEEGSNYTGITLETITQFL